MWHRVMFPLAFEMQTTKVQFPVLQKHANHLSYDVKVCGWKYCKLFEKIRKQIEKLMGKMQ